MSGNFEVIIKICKIKLKLKPLSLGRLPRSTLNLYLNKVKLGLLLENKKMKKTQKMGQLESPTNLMTRALMKNRIAMNLRTRSQTFRKSMRRMNVCKYQTKTDKLLIKLSTVLFSSTNHLYQQSLSPSVKLLKKPQNPKGLKKKLFLSSCFWLKRVTTVNTKNIK